MGVVLLKLDEKTDSFLLRELGKLAEAGKVTLRQGREGVVEYMIAQAMENENKEERRK